MAHIMGEFVWPHALPHGCAMLRQLRKNMAQDEERPKHSMNQTGLSLVSVYLHIYLSPTVCSTFALSLFRSIPFSLSRSVRLPICCVMPNGWMISTSSFSKLVHHLIHFVEPLVLWNRIKGDELLIDPTRPYDWQLKGVHVCVHA